MAILTWLGCLRRSHGPDGRTCSEVELGSVSLSVGRETGVRALSATLSRCGSRRGDATLRRLRGHVARFRFCIALTNRESRSGASRGTAKRFAAWPGAAAQTFSDNRTLKRRSLGRAPRRPGQGRASRSSRLAVCFERFRPLAPHLSLAGLPRPSPRPSPRARGEGEFLYYIPTQGGAEYSLSWATIATALQAVRRKATKSGAE